MNNASQLPLEGYIRIKQLIGDGENLNPIIPVSAGTIWNWVRQGIFPEPIKLSAAITAWKVEDVRHFLENGGGQNGE